MLSVVVTDIFTTLGELIVRIIIMVTTPLQVKATVSP